jgi:dTMP kinase
MGGLFLVFEGIDGCGKSTQASWLAAALTKAGRDPLHLREPGGTWLGEELRKLLLSPTSHIGSMTEALLYMAARAQLVSERIAEQRASRVILLERYYYSTVSYQGHGLSLDAGRLEALGQWVVGGVEPDRVLLFDLDGREARRRIRRGEDRIEQRDEEFFSRVRQGYLAQAAARPALFRVIDASGTPEAVHARVLEAVHDLV